MAVNGTVSGPLAAASPLGTVGQMPAAIVAASPGLGLVPGSSATGLRVDLRATDGGDICPNGFGLEVCGPIAHDAAISTSNPVRIGARARAINSFFGSVASDDVVDFISTLRGQQRIVLEASGEANGTTTAFNGSEAGGSTPVAINASPGNIYWLSVSNPNTSDVYLQLFNAATGSVTVGTTTPFCSFCIPGGTGASNRGIYDMRFNPPLMFTTASTYAVTTTPTGSTAPGSSVTVNIGHR